MDYSVLLGGVTSGLATAVAGAMMVNPTHKKSGFIFISIGVVVVIASVIFAARAKDEGPLALINNQQEQLDAAKVTIEKQKEENARLEHEISQLRVRRLTPEQMKEIVDTLIPHKGSKIEILCINEDIFCVQWKEAFRDAGWQRVATLGRSIEMAFDGIGIASKEKNPKVESIIKAVNSIGEKPMVDFKKEILAEGTYQLLIGEHVSR
jgi:hypothetical protein